MTLESLYYKNSFLLTVQREFTKEAFSSSFTFIKYIRDCDCWEVKEELKKNIQVPKAIKKKQCKKGLQKKIVNCENKKGKVFKKKNQFL